MGRQLFADGPYLDPPIANSGALVATTAEALWLGTQFTPIFANEPKAGRIYCVRAGGILSTAAGAATLTLIPQYGAIGGTTLGTSAAQNTVVSLTNVPWYLAFDLVFRTIGATGGANGTAMGTGFFQSGGAAATAASSMDLTFGGTSAAVDTTANSGITFSKTLTVAGSFTTMFAYGFWRN